jgi:hypothetical protein
MATYQHTDGTPVTVTELTELDALLANIRDKGLRCLRALLAVVSEPNVTWPPHTKLMVSAARARIKALMYLLARDPRARHAIAEWQDQAVEAALAYDDIGEDMNIGIHVSDQSVDVSTARPPNEGIVLTQAESDKAMHRVFEAAVCVLDAIGAWAE